ncbi:MAG: flagellar protein FlaG [Desulfobacterota bacterium]|nr:flagellar protein FlaG [Thermodesulfobacteriota bacterium]MDW8002562.1 flagellar protein FlaG [Deltaproteobacteria bacterium]
METKIDGLVRLLENLELKKVTLPKREFPKENIVRKKTEENLDPKEITERIKEFLETVNRNTILKMRYDKDIDRVIVTILEEGTEKVIRQIPPEELVAFLKRFRNSLSVIFERSV